MKKIALMSFPAIMFASCGTQQGDKPWIVARFDDVKVIRYEVPGFEELPLEQKELVFYLAEAAKCGRDILFDQNCPANLPVRRTLETVYEHFEGDRSTAEWQALEKYLKKVWFANGIHHHYSNDKFVPEFSQPYFEAVIASIPAEKLGELAGLQGEVVRSIFDPAYAQTRLNQSAGVDMIAASANNYYGGELTQEEVEAYYTARTDANDPEPISYGLNSRLVKEASMSTCSHSLRKAYCR